MALREIEMDIPYIRNDNVSPDDSVADYEKNWKDKRFKFRLMTRCMTSMIDRLKPRIETEGCSKIVIECVEANPREKIINLDCFFFVQIPFHIDEFFSMDDLSKKQYVIEKVLEAVDVLEIKKGFDLSEIKKVCDTIKQKNYVNEWTWKRTAKRKNRIASVVVKHEIDEVRIYINISDNGSDSGEEYLVACEKPDEWFYSRLFGKLKWASDEEVQLIAKDGEIHSVQVVPGTKKD